jgi:hypothetical protein
LRSINKGVKAGILGSIPKEELKDFYTDKIKEKQSPQNSTIIQGEYDFEESP